jgi:pimeloyl-ACP methyl ester carboxylesterase
VAVPALAVYGEHDRLTPPDFHEYLAEHLPDAELVEIADAAHLPFVERPAAFDAAVSEFLAGH